MGRRAPPGGRSRLSTPQAPQLLKAQLKKSPAEEGSRNQLRAHQSGSLGARSPYPRSPRCSLTHAKCLLAHSDPAGAGIRPKTYIQTCTHKTHVQKQRTLSIHAQVPAEALEAWWVGLGVRTTRPRISFRPYPYRSSVPIPACSQAPCVPAVRRRLSTPGLAPYLPDSRWLRVGPWRAAGQVGTGFRATALGRLTRARRGRKIR